MYVYKEKWKLLVFQLSTGNHWWYFAVYHFFDEITAGYYWFSTINVPERCEKVMCENDFYAVWNLDILKQ